MGKHALILALTSLLFSIFFIRLKHLFKKRTHYDYLLMISISAFRTTLITSYCIFTIAFSFVILNKIFYIGNYFESNSIMEKTIGLGLFVLVSSWVTPFFFIQEIEFSDGKIIIDNESVPWSLKKFSTQTEYSCYIQIHRKKERETLSNNKF